MKAKRATWIVTPTGGVLAPADLRAVAELSLARGDGCVRVNGRQQLLLEGIEGAEAPSGFASGRIRIERAVRGLPPNPVSTLPVLAMARHTPWLTKRIYEEALETLRRRGRIAVTLSDPCQDFLPVSGSELNFIASETPNAWHVALHDAGARTYATLHGAVHTANLGDVAEWMSALGKMNGDAAASALAAWLGPRLTPSNGHPCPTPRYRRTAGPHRTASGDAMFLGIPFGDDGLPSRFLHDVCLHIVQAGIADIGLTPWRCLLLHPIDETVADTVRKTMAAHRVAESAPWIEHWYLTPGAARFPGLDRLRRTLADRAPSGGGVSLAISEASEPAPDADILVSLSNTRPALGMPWRRSRYDADIHIRRQGGGMELTARVPENKLAESILFAMDRLVTVPTGIGAPRDAAPAPLRRADAEWACPSCAMTYDERIGDRLGGVAPGTAFSALPATWSCPVCGEAKAAFAESPA